ncbi:uncharacterized protein LOC128995989 [Macrosteles quadrilineatus]|uniref:uncharacterized protein LOC128995989 n=1 Tax=Macrosteles quadrilineatus TaxID=74068 RepID=UPI0023E2E840|nr:uncharacterized protein LOC128995989 [Macrosteles quadrilineatus]
MKIFLFIFEMSVLTCLVWETGAEPGAKETVDFELETCTDRAKPETCTTKILSWEIEVVGKKVTSDSDYVNRLENHKDKKLAVFYSISGDEAKYKAEAAKGFARHGVPNGVYLIVDLVNFSGEIKNELPSKDTLSFEWKRKYTFERIADKVAYEKRHENYNDVVLVTMFHNFEPGCKYKDFNNEDCVDLTINRALLSYEGVYYSEAVPVVVLVVHVDLVGKESIKSLCPNRGVPKQYPAFFTEYRSKLFEIREPGATEKFNLDNC